jgi:hypothetical protein
MQSSLDNLYLHLRMRRKQDIASRLRGAWAGAPGRNEQDVVTASLAQHVVGRES